ncbi:MAG: alkyl hydroperoxide reductase [Caldilineaceae bacterium]
MRQLREQYPHELVVIGVHSAKFPTEKLTANIRAAVIRHGIQHPVVNDADFTVWSQYGVRAWPTTIVVDPLGKVVGQQMGEMEAEHVAAFIDMLIADFKAQGILDQTPLPEVQSKVIQGSGRLLQHPSKLLYTPGDRLFIADTGHHRVVEVQLSLDGLSGEMIRIFGSGTPGLQDGKIAQAQFHAPHGLALRGATLYVADTENHAIRAIDLVREQVHTVAGTGQKARGLAVRSAAPTAMNLRSPWALAVLEEMLWIAMAGSHQLWVLVREDQLGVFAGTGAEALVDGRRSEASFTQPSDLALTMGHLFVADAEASAIRALPLDDASQVSTLVGQGLFTFGDTDGVGAAVRLQHPMGLAADDRLLYIADSYNHKIKTLDPVTREVQTLIGTGAAGDDDGNFQQARLFEPEGLVLADERIYIADTNNHKIRMADLRTQQVHTIQLRN